MARQILKFLKPSQEGAECGVLSLMLLAFLSHTIFALTDSLYQSLRHELGSRKTFSDDIRALLRYQLFRSWQHLLLFMADALELDSS
jgi:hypothetical protein